MKIGFLGPGGTYTEEAAQRAAVDADRIAYPSIDAVFAAVHSREVDLGLVPIENLIQGPVTETLDNLYAYTGRVRIVDMVLLEIEHALGSLSPDLSAINRVLSKDQALKQCSAYLDTYLSKAARIETASTSEAMSRVAQEGWHDAAAIGSASALARYGLPVLARNISNVALNKTRFAVLASAPSAAQYSAQRVDDTLPAATQVVVYPHHDRVGLLEEILGIVSRKHSLNLYSIHSRPDKRGGFRFYLELEGQSHDQALRACLDDLKKRVSNEAIEVIEFGSYPFRPFIESKITSIGIIGGTGLMGRWFERLFTRAGYRVLIAGRATDLSYEECITQADAVLINVPIRNTIDVIKKVGPLFKSGQLIVDNTSIKTEPVKAMLASVSPGVEVLGMHTVFGPAVENVQGENVIFTRTQTSAELAKEFENIFFKYGARITHTTPDHHDKQMALHQNLEHFTKVVLAQIVVTHFDDISELERYSSPNSKATLATVARIMRGDPELYAEIQRFNSQGPALIEAFVKVAQTLSAGIAKGDSSQFKQAISQSAQILDAEWIHHMLDES